MIHLCLEREHEGSLDNGYLDNFDDRTSNKLKKNLKVRKEKKTLHIYS
jgi:hypothetical protein